MPVAGTPDVLLIEEVL